MLKMSKNNSGFTLIELIIVIAIIGVLATAVISGTDFIDQRAQAVDVGNYNIARNLQSAMEQYYIQNPNANFTNNTLLEAANSSGVTNKSIITVLKEANILKSDYSVATDTFYFKLVNGNPQVEFKLASKRYITSSISNCSINRNGFWRVPGCGQLK
jgi:prepilin-type N-terminal cleavage/methylation domain-containing protein